MEFSVPFKMKCSHIKWGRHLAEFLRFGVSKGVSPTAVSVGNIASFTGNTQSQIPKDLQSPAKRTLNSMVVFLRT